MTTTDTITTADQEPVKRKQTGRPRKAIKRSTFLMVRMTPTERLLIEERSKRAGIKPSDWFRRSAKSAKLYPRFTAEETGWFRMLSGLANNLNQLTKLAHNNGLFLLANDCKELLKKIEELLDKISKDRT